MGKMTKLLDTTFKTHETKSICWKKIKIMNVKLIKKMNFETKYYTY